ncbi:MAG: hypothetical protein P1V13_01900 [Rhizobiaceae bacterium]|nr:hypothetical protein [Rhizobiaceae bacterium]
MILNVAIVLVVVVSALLLWSPRLYALVTWRAMTTPLASIIGSGFLVLGPLLDTAYGKYAPVIMALLCLFAYFYGAAIRYNMRVIERPGEKRSPLVGGLETAASWSLGFAYIISVAYYLNLFGAFGVSLTAINEPLPAKILTSAVYVIIVVAGWRRGFKSLEQMEYISVTAKLAIIAGLLLGLAVYFYGKATDGGLIFNAPDLGGWPALTLAFGLIVTVQGFETSRYLSADYDSHTRIRSMQWAQWLSTVIYMLYILLLAFVFERGALQFSETAIVDMMAIVAPILPVLLVAAALAAQFSAAVADTSGSGGLVAELTGGRVSARMAYVMLTGIGLALTWSAGIFDIISYASRAFAAYYGLQAFIAMLNAWRQDDRWHSLAFAALTLLAVLIVLFGQAVEQ